MHRDMSYRKPVPIYIPSPPPSPETLPTQLPHSFDHSPIAPQHTPSHTILTGTQSLLLNSTLLLEKSPDEEEILIEDANYTPLTAPPCTPPDLERHAKRKLHQPSFTDNIAASSPELQRTPSMTALSFMALQSQNTSFHTEKTYVSFESQVGDGSTLCSMAEAGLHRQNVARSNIRSRLGLQTMDDDETVSWWVKIGVWGASFGQKAKRFTRRMERDTDSNTPNRREPFKAFRTTTTEPSAIPLLRSDPPQTELQRPHTLQAFRDSEGREIRKRRLLELWKRLPQRKTRSIEHGGENGSKLGAQEVTPAQAEKLRAMYAAYDDELYGHCGVRSSSTQSGEIPWKQFKEYAEAKELWSIFHDELDLDGNGQLDAQELNLALVKAGINLSPKMLSEFMSTLTASPNPQEISFSEFRDFLLLLPRKVSAAEIYQYYEVSTFMGDDGRGPARLTMEGDALLSAEDKPPEVLRSSLPPTSSQATSTLLSHENHETEEFEDEQEPHGLLEGHPALKFLLAGGVAGAAPFDRLKIFLITRPPHLGGAPVSPTPSLGGMRTIANAVARIYAEGGVLAFWTGNGLSVAKIFPESAIKFFAYESSKRLFAQYWDKVDDPREISGVSRFLSGGIGGISSQLSIYPIETLKTQMMSGQQRRTLIEAARHVWSLGGARAYYRGLSLSRLAGNDTCAFRYSAIDMSTFEALKLAYLKSTGKDEPGVLALLAFGSVSGSVGATSVYPLNLIRTRLQASGSSGHPQRYTGVMDVAVKTWERDGWRGFYRGLFPTLAKVVPAVSISYVVYEHAKRK
ncbi:hypothetical protein H0H92_008030 [Tricholoma furcatifolium]|nr:hypothetical protein H0H92_008030 [Tricholoma furcatifolium]